ncbi:MAG: hypothetical protein K2X55_12020 [Burkholderiaceae bacterium]|nr:hypothetical protein [Burkholderiaceae bacterium]
MFGTIPGRGNGTTTFVNYNGKAGLFVIDHNAQNAEGTLREHTTTTGRKVYKEEYPDLLSAFVRRVIVKEEDVYQKPGEKENKILVSLRSPDGKDAVVKFSMGSGALQVLGAINASDLTQPITLKNYLFQAGSKGKDKEGNEVVRLKDEVRLVGYQGDQKLINKYGEGEVVIPKIDKIEVKHPVSGKLLETVNDFTAQHEFIVNLAKNVNTKVQAASGSQPAPVAPQAQPAPAATADDAQLSASDILGEDDGGAGDAAAFAQGA